MAPRDRWTVAESDGRGGRVDVELPVVKEVFVRRERFPRHNASQGEFVHVDESGRETRTKFTTE